MSSTLSSIQNSKQQPSGGSKTFSNLLCFQDRIHVEKREAPEAAGKRQLHCHMGGPSTWSPQTTVGTQRRTGQSLHESLWLPAGFLLWAGKFYYHLTTPHHISHFKTPVLRCGITWSLQSFALPHRCFQPTEFRLAVRKCGKRDSVASRQSP